MGCSCRMSTRLAQARRNSCVGDASRQNDPENRRRRRRVERGGLIERSSNWRWRSPLAKAAPPPRQRRSRVVVPPTLLPVCRGGTSSCSDRMLGVRNLGAANLAARKEGERVFSSSTLSCCLQLKLTPPPLI